MTGPASTCGPVSNAQIANLLAWARSLSETGPAADPAAYQAAKTALLARLADPHPDTSQPSTKDAL